jgi:hypothetical protein
MNKPASLALRRSGNGSRHSACGGGEIGWCPQREEKREGDALGRKRKERDKVYHLIERFRLRSEVRAIELGGWRMEWGDFRLQSGVFNGKLKTLLGFYSKISHHRCRNFMRERYSNYALCVTVALANHQASDHKTCCSSLSLPLRKKSGFMGMGVKNEGRGMMKEWFHGMAQG